MTVNDKLDPNLLSTDQDEMVRRELTADEKVVWIGRPIPRRKAIDAIPISIIGLVFGGMGTFLPMIMPRDVEAGFVAVFVFLGSPFLLTGLVMMAWPVLSYRWAYRTVYALTNRRAITFEASVWGRNEIRSFEAERLGSTSRVERPDGSGDLILEERIKTDDEGSKTVDSRGFLAIADVREVHRLLRLHLLKNGRVLAMPRQFGDED